LEITRVARGALRSVALDLTPQARQDLTDGLKLACLSPDTDTWRKTAEQMLEDGCRVTDLIDIYIPSVARRLGDDWVADRAGFAQVTLGCARLGLLLGWADDRLDDLDLAPTMQHGKVCLTAPEGGQHRLGQQVFMTQLLRSGVTAHLLDASETMEDADVVMISASGQEDATDLRSAVDRARSLGPSPVVILGGGAVELTRALCMAAGADLVTNDLDQALSACRSHAQATRLGR
jgi:methanogenic corrinoid protein MtbC1